MQTFDPQNPQQPLLDPTDGTTDLTPMQLALMRFMLDLRRRGITDHTLLQAFEQIWRPDFLAKPYAVFAYEDRLLPIASGQIAESPFILAAMLQMLNIESRHRILEIGAGTGYSTALLARLGRRVLSMERSATLVRWSEERLARLGAVNATVIHEDGNEGYGLYAPYDRILISVAVEQMPQVIIEQLAEGGRCIVPIGKEHTTPMLWLITRRNGQISEQPIAPTRTTVMQRGLLKAI